MPVYNYTTLDDPSSTLGTFGYGINASRQIVGVFDKATGSCARVVAPAVDQLSW